MSVVPLRAMESEATFDDFWTLWPKRVAKLDAERAWKRLTPKHQLAAVVGLVAWRAVWVADGRLQYVPHASTWLNGQRWEDEMPEQWSATRSSHLPAQLPAKGERAEMPQSVRDAIARLRAR